MTITIKSVTYVLFVTFVIWYLLRRTALGSAYVSDLWSIPQWFTSFVGMEGTPGQVTYGVPRREIFRG